MSCSICHRQSCSTVFHSHTEQEHATQDCGGPGRCEYCEPDTDALIAQITELTSRLAGLRDELEIAQIQNARLSAERDQLRGVIERVMLDEWGYHDPQAPDMQDELENMGLLVRVPGDERFRENFPGDEMLTFAWGPLARIADEEKQE